MRLTKALAAPLLVLSLLASGCGDDGPEDLDGSRVDVPDREPDLLGTITFVAPFVPVTEDCIPADELDPDGTVSSDDPPVCTPEDSDVLGTILVEAELAPEQGRKISYTVTADATITGTNPDGTGVAVFADLAEGQQADTWATGPCAESYPEQCTLEAIRVTE